MSILTLLYEQKFKTEYNSLKKLNINVFALERMPRISRAQSMDVLSSQSNLSGYKGIYRQRFNFNKAFPLMMTSGTVTNKSIGYRCRGLLDSTIATAKRLGAVVSSFDVRTSTKNRLKFRTKFIEVKVKTLENDRWVC